MQYFTVPTYDLQASRLLKRRKKHEVPVSKCKLMGFYGKSPWPTLLLYQHADLLEKIVAGNTSTRLVFPDIIQFTYLFMEIIILLS